MNISFENKSADCFREIFHQVKRIQESAESVVPDVNDDIGKIATVQPSVFLKSKEITGRGVLVTGEACASVLYITEDEQSVSGLRLTKPFSIEYELQNPEQDNPVQIKLDIPNCEARIINPRKVSILFEVTGELSCYRQDKVVTETVLPAAASAGIHAKIESAELVYANAVCEKTFALSEQFIVPAGKPMPSALISYRAEFDAGDSQLVGSKLITKGAVNVSVCYFSEEVNYPVKLDFSTPFSQIADVGTEEMENCSILFEGTSLFCDLITTISGEKAVEAEIHGVMQIVARSRQKISYISDVYSNRMPTICSYAEEKEPAMNGTLALKMIADEKLSLTDDCEDVLCVFPCLSQVSLQRESISATVILDIVYRTKSGTLTSARRLINLGSECGKGTERLLKARLIDIYLRPDGNILDAHLAAEVKYLCCQELELSRVTAVTLDEEQPYQYSSFPAVSIVRAEEESLWELAKTYHSSIERIQMLNDMESEMKGRLLIIPKEIC